MASTKKATAKKAPAKSTPAKKPALKLGLKAPKPLSASPAPKTESAVAGATPVTAATKTKPSVEVIDGVKVYHGITLPQRAVAITSDLDKIKVGGLVFFDTTIDTSAYKDEKEAVKAQREAAAVKANRANGQVRRYTKRNPDTKFIVRTLPNAKSMGFDTDVGVVIQRTK